MNINNQDIYYDKYIKYKTKYLELKEQSGGTNTNTNIVTDLNTATTNIVVATESCICDDNINETCYGNENILNSDNIENIKKLEPHITYNIHKKYFEKKKYVFNDLLNYLIKKNTYFLFGQNKISIDFEFIKRLLNNLLHLYNDFGIFIYNYKYKPKFIETYIFNKDQILKLKIFVDDKIKNIIQNIKKKENLDKDINDYIKINEDYFKTNYPNHNFDIKGLDNLQFIITSYLEKINKGIMCSIPKF
jgi:hypothetical protein